MLRSIFMCMILLPMSVVFLAVGCQTKAPQTLCYFDTDCPSHIPVCSSGVCIIKNQGEGGLNADGGSIDSPSSTRCSTGQLRSCYEGPAGTENKGACRSGEALCVRDRWGTCDNQVLPSKEICDGKDNDCNGLIDEVCTQCSPGEKQPCYTGPAGTSGKGLCRSGHRVCLGTKQFSACQGEVLPSAEVCDSVDNNCDGQIDEGCPGCSDGAKRACYTGPSVHRGKGACKDGQQVCKGKVWGPCLGQVLPKRELCDKVDNDCDGQVDEACVVCIPGSSKPCSTGKGGCILNPQVCKGTCKLGVQRCTVAGRWGHCEGAKGPQVEICNGLDDSCNGKIDDAPKPVLCVNQVGACAGATKPCVQGKSIACTNAHYQKYNPKAKFGKGSDTCDGVDNNCNGVVDEDCVKGCSPGAKRPCYAGHPSTLGKGICKAGTQTCKADRKWGGCVQQVLPGVETCNTKDDDCDGFIDESFPQQGKQCTSSRPGICAPGFFHCSKGSVQCVSSFQPRKEICNGKDDDCNGKIDDGAPGVTYYRDADSDTFGDPNQPKTSCRRPPGYVSDNTDCYDKNANVHPRQFQFFTKHRGDGSFDYNCDTKESRRFTRKGDCKQCRSPVIDIGFLKPQQIPCGAQGDWVDMCRFDVGKCIPKTIKKYQECH